MIIKICLSVTTLIFFLDDSRISCAGIGHVFDITNKLLGKSLKRFLPFDMSSSYGLMKDLTYIKTKVGKLQNSSGNIQNAILAETESLLKETVLPFPAVTDEDIHFYHPQSENGEFTLEELSETQGKLFFIVHGWNEDISDAEWCRKLAMSLTNVFKKSEVVLVDWGSSSNKYLYPLAALRTKTIGKLIANRITELVEKHCFPLEDIIFIGYDLGAHVCGHVGRFFAETNNKKLPEIIGLDPSALLFEGRNPEERLDETDAEIVMVVHSETSMVGVKECGTIDFYPNGGSDQPGCMKWNLLCNHQRSYQLFTAAISDPEKFPTMECNSSNEYEEKGCEDSDVYFGNIMEKSKGKYYFATTDKEPFYQRTKSRINPLNWSIRNILHNK
ncbi:lipase member H-like [Harmonia axyridis]|uniref:lipase member H-like n=1 Tax=Harmonia axyridis TaxID=115357 RepID=UPI001E276B10|nr:lipase member H-like [Harmonia axyridis]